VREKAGNVLAYGARYRPNVDRKNTVHTKQRSQSTERCLVYTVLAWGKEVD